MAKKSKKDKTKKKPKAPPKPKPKPKPKPHKYNTRQNPNQVKRIPAKVGATSRANITQVVAPTGARGGVDSYKKRTKEEILAEKIAKAQATLGLQQQTAPRPVIQRPRGVVKPPAVVGGYTGLTSGYGLQENSSKKLNEKLKNMEDRILNEVKKQTNPAAVNAEDTKSRTNSLIQEVSSRSIETQTETKPSPALVASRLRARNRNDNFNRFTPVLSTDADVEKDKQLEREEKEKQDEAKLQIRKDEKEAEQKYVGLHTLRMNKDKNVKKKAVNSILDNILTNVIETADSHVLEKQQEKKEKQDRDTAIQLQKQQQQEERDRAIKQKRDIDNEQKERAQQARKLMEKASQDVKEQERKQKEIKQLSSGLVQDVIGKSLVKVERDEEKKQKQKDDKEDEVRPLEINRANISRQNRLPKVEEDLSVETQLQNMLETTGEMEDIVGQIQEEEEEEEGEEDEYPPPVSQETLQKARDKHPLPPSRSSISTQTSAVEQAIPMRGRELKERAALMKEARKPRDVQRPPPTPPALPPRGIELPPPPLLPPRDTERPLPTPPDRPLPPPPSDKKDIAKSALSSIIDSSFDRAVKKAKERKAELKEEARQQRIQRDLQIKKEQKLRTERGDERMKRDRNKRTSLLAAASAVDDILTKTEKEIDLAATRKAIQAESKLRKVGQGRKKLVEESLQMRGDIPEELKDLMKYKDSLKDQQRSATQALINLGLNNKTIPYNARNLTVVRNHRDDDAEKEKIRQLYENHRDPQIQKLLPDAMKLVQELLTAKRESKKIQDKITRMRKK